MNISIYSVQRKVDKRMYQFFLTIGLSVGIWMGILPGILSARALTLESQNFQFVWSKHKQALTIKSKTHQQTIWQSSSEMIQSGIVNLDIKDNRGSFHFQPKYQLKCEHPVFNSFQTNENRMVLKGHYSTPECPGSIVIEFQEKQPHQLHFNVALKPNLAKQTKPYNFLQMNYSSHPNERFYGFGEQPSVLNLKGQVVPVLSQENGIGRGAGIHSFLVNLFSPGSQGHDGSTYIATPFYFTNQNHSLYIKNSEYMTFDLRKADQVSLQVYSPQIKGIIFDHNHPLDFIEAYTSVVGRQPSLPSWIHRGAIVGMQGGTQKVIDIWKQIRKRNIPVSAFWLQDWVGKRKTIVGSQLWWNWELDQAHYPIWKDLLKEFKLNGIQLLGYINPFLVELPPDKKVKRNLFKEAKERDYLVKSKAGHVHYIMQTDFRAGLLDLTNPKAREWFKLVVKDNLIAIGLKGWMADFGEALPFDAKLHSGVSAQEYHNQYPVEWAKLNQEILKESLPEGLFFTRSGFSGSQAVTPLFWEGDQMTNWDDKDGLKSAITGLLSGGFSGFALNHSDIGGYTSISNLGITRSRELLIRWMEMNAFTAVFRTHEGLQPESNSQFYSDELTWAAFKRFSQLYAKLAPYRKAVFKEAYQKGYPVVRHPLLHYNDDPVVHTLKYQFMLGKDIMVAPYTQPRELYPLMNSTDLNLGLTNINYPGFPWYSINPLPHQFRSEHYQKRVYLPATPQPWVHLWSKKSFPAKTGEWVTVAAPPGYPAVFYQKGSLAEKVLNK